MGVLFTHMESSETRSTLCILETHTELSGEKIHRACLHCGGTLRVGPLTACCEAEEMGSLTSALSRTSVSGVGHLFPREGVTVLFPLDLACSGGDQRSALPPPPLQDSAPAADSKEPPVCSVTRDPLNASGAQGFSCLGLRL